MHSRCWLHLCLLVGPSNDSYKVQFIVHITVVFVLLMFVLHKLRIEIHAEPCCWQTHKVNAIQILCGTYSGSLKVTPINSAVDMMFCWFSVYYLCKLPLGLEVESVIVFSTTCTLETISIHVWWLDCQLYTHLTKRLILLQFFVSFFFSKLETVFTDITNRWSIN